LGIVIKQSGISAFFTYLGAIIGFANTVVLFPAFLTTEQIGLIRVIPSIAFLLMPFAQLGLVPGLLKFYPELKNKPGGLAQLLTVVGIGVISGFVVVASLLLLFESEISGYFSENSDLLNQYFYVIVVLVLILSVHSLFEVYSRIFLKIIAANIIKEFLIRVLISIAVSCYFLKIIPFDLLVTGLLLIYTIALLSMVGYIAFIGQLKFSFRFDQLDKGFLKKLANYSFFIIIGSSGSYIILNIDQLMITSMLGLQANGIYTTAFYFAVMIELSRRAISQITTPLISENFEQQNLSAIEKIYKQISINQMVIGTLFFIGIVCNLEGIFSLMPNGEVFRVGKYVVYYIGLSKLLDMIFANNSEIITLSKYYRFNVLTIAILAFLMIAMNLILIPIYGIDGAAIASMVALILYNLIKLIFIWIKLNIQPFSGKTGILFLIGLVIFVFGFWIPPLSNLIADILVRSTIITIVYFLAIYYLKISPEVNGLIDRMFGK